MPSWWTISQEDQDAEREALAVWWSGLGLQIPRGGVEIRPGWFPLVETLVSKLRSLGWNEEVHQVKQKLGGLRFYVGVTTEAIREAIRKAEDASFSICEDCGHPGQRLHKGGYITTLCSRCSELWDADSPCEKPFL